MLEATSKTKEQVLEEVFGYRSFRTGQETLINAILTGRDTLGIMPTGAGKSVCYQVPALCMQGITLVVSPLISLMKDQVGALVQEGVAAAYLNSSLNPAQQRTVLARAAEGRYKIMYVAPERLCTDSFLAWACGADIAMLTVDEAHCISQWGQDFRPSYLQIAQFISLLPHRPVVSAFTATATGRVKEDIIASLNLQSPEVLVTGFDRPNLYFEVRHPQGKPATLLELVGEMKNKSGIVYCSTRKGVEEVCDLLTAHGYAATRYHAGLPPEERQRNQDDFLFDRATVMAATNAFGMGIDKSNVSYVIHYNMPKNIESYYQEAGRAGRDGEAARCILLYSGQDVRIQQMLLERSDAESPDMDAETRATILAQNKERLKQMTFYCTTTHCLRAFLLRYFGENVPDHCTNCGNCLSVDMVDLSSEARDALACVRELESNGKALGKWILGEILRGNSSEKVTERHLNELNHFGALDAMTAAQIRALLDQLIEENCLSVSEGEYPVLELADGAKAILNGGTFMGRIPHKKVKKPASVSVARPATTGNAAPELLSRLRDVRLSLAQERKVPAFFIFSDASLADMATLCPTDETAFRQVRGVGAEKARQFAAPFTEAIRAWKAQGPQLSSHLSVSASISTRPVSHAAPKPAPAGEKAPAESAHTPAVPQASPASADEANEALYREVMSGASLLDMQQRHGGSLRELCLRLAALDLDEPF